MEVYTCVVRKNTGKIWPTGESIWNLCGTFNHAGNPRRLMTERDHHRAAQIVRAVKNRMKRLNAVYGVHYKELSNGSYWPMRAIE